MSRVAPQPDRPTRRRAARGTLVLGLLVCLPRLIVAWLVLPPAFDVLLVALTLLFVAGLLVIAVAVFRFQALRTDVVWPIGVVGAVAVLVSGIVVRLAPAGTAAPLDYDGGLLAPPAAIAYQYLYLLLGAMSQLGLMLIVGAVGVAITHRRSARG